MSDLRDEAITHMAQALEKHTLGDKWDDRVRFVARGEVEVTLDALLDFLEGGAWRLWADAKRDPRHFILNYEELPLLAALRGTTEEQ